MKNDGPLPSGKHTGRQGLCPKLPFCNSKVCKSFSLRRLQGSPLFEKGFKKTPFVLFCLQRLFCRDYNRDNRLIARTPAAIRATLKKERMQS